MATSLASASDLKPVGGRAVLYARTASSRQHDDSSSQRQLEACRRWAEQHGLTVSKEFADIGFSGMTADRPALRALLDYFETHPVDYVICEQPSTMARSRPLGLLLAMFFKLKGARLIVASRDTVLDDSPAHVRSAPRTSPDRERTA